MSYETDFEDVDRVFRARFGRGLDFAEIASFGSPEYQWLAVNGLVFGFRQPVRHRRHGHSPEPWHWVHLHDPRPV